MCLCVKQQLKKLSNKDYLSLIELCHAAKNLYNVAIYNIRQHYFSTKEYLSYNDNYKLCRENENYQILNSYMAQQIIMEADGAFKFYNKENARLQSIKDKQKAKGCTKQQYAITDKRNNFVNDYISKACRLVINYCIENDVGILVLGYNKDMQNCINIGRKNNQNFANIPVGKIRDKLTYLCKLYSVKLVEQEESYTSKASFWDKDEIPSCDGDSHKACIFSGKRVKWGCVKQKAACCSTLM